MQLTVSDLRSFLCGGWRIERRLADRRNAIRGTLHGEAHFVPAASALHYQEEGMLAFGAHRGRAEQAYRYDFPAGPATACISFRDGRPFHELDLSGGSWRAIHRCGHDLYEGRFTLIARDRWISSWKVTGPRKDQAIFTLYARADRALPP